MICFDRKKANLFLIQLIVCTDIHNDGSKCGEPPVFNVQLNTIIFFFIHVHASKKILSDLAPSICVSKNSGTNRYT